MVYNSLKPVDKVLLTSLICMIQKPKGQILVYLLTICSISTCKLILLISASKN